MRGDGWFRPQSERQPWLAPDDEKKSLNEEDFPLFTHRRCPIGERVVCFFFLPPK
jgi:hypothetical protein